MNEVNVYRKIADKASEALVAALWELERLRGEVDRILVDWAKENWEIEQILGKALEYPRYTDDPENFPDATGDDVCVGDQVAITLAREAAERIMSLTADLDEELDPGSVGSLDEQRTACGPHERKDLLRSDLGCRGEDLERIDF